MAWKKFATKEEMEKEAESYHCDFKDHDWSGPGWYWCYSDRQRCPRGCCWDTFFRVRTAEEQADETRREMKEYLEAYQLAKKYKRENERERKEPRGVADGDG